MSSRGKKKQISRGSKEKGRGETFSGYSGLATGGTHLRKDGDKVDSLALARKSIFLARGGSRALRVSPEKRGSDPVFSRPFVRGRSNGGETRAPGRPVALDRAKKVGRRLHVVYEKAARSRGNPRADPPSLPRNLTSSALLSTLNTPFQPHLCL